MIEESGKGSPPQISLQCLNGAAAPPLAAEGWRALAAFPNSAREEFWEMLGLAIMEPATPGHQERVESFCSAHKMEVASVLGALGACDFLLGTATALNLEPEALRQDLTALSAGQTALADEFLSRYQSAKPLLRNRLIEATLADHGKLLTGLDWRVDNVTASDRGAQPNASVVYLTLRYRGGDDQNHVTLQMTPEALKLLKGFTDRFGGG